jgi:anti-sigma regulatory factor (Ser/Thr protein kinase)
MGPTRVTQIRRSLADCTDVDGVARVVLAGMLELPAVVRAGLALTAPGGRQLHFLPSDPDRLRRKPEWCLIDAYDDLPLNDCVRTGTPVLFGSPDALARAYPGLAKAQVGTGIRSVCSVPVTHAGDRLGGLLMYFDEDVTDEDDATLGTAIELADVVAAALEAVRPKEQWPLDPAAPDRAGEAAGECLLPPDPRSPGLARRWLLGALADLDITGEPVAAALVCTSELVTNVVMHSGRPSVLTLEREGQQITLRLRHRVDPSPRRILEATDAGPLRISGHGLVLVDALSAEWGHQEADGIVTDWCRLRVGS